MNNSPENSITSLKPSNSSQSVPAKDLGPLPNINDEHWPKAVPDNMIVSHRGAPEKKYRALQIIGMLGIPVAGKRVLDCGCGEGYVTAEAAQQAELSVGYDIEAHDNWGTYNKQNLIYTSDTDVVNSDGPYDLIILYDVLDQLKGVDPVAFLKWLRTLMVDNGQIYVRTHPWTAKHGGGIYDQMNKAYIHLALTPDELIKSGIRPLHNLKISRPMATYEKWFADAALNIESRNIEAEIPAEYVRNHLIDRIIKLTWGGTIDKEQAIKIMANQFIDYKLRK